MSASDAKAGAIMDHPSASGPADRANDRVEKLSLGNQQRVQIIAALMTRPEGTDPRRALLRFGPTAVDSMADLLREHTSGRQRPCSSPVTNSTSSSDSATTPSCQGSGRRRRHCCPTPQPRAAAVSPRPGSDAGWVRGRARCPHGRCRRRDRGPRTHRRNPRADQILQRDAPPAARSRNSPASLRPCPRSTVR